MVIEFPDIPIKPIFWREDKLFIIDQTKLPFEYCEIEIRNISELISAIKRLAIRGAPALGISAAYGLVLGLKECKNWEQEKFAKQFEVIAQQLLNSRPTAVNIRWAIERMRKKLQKLLSQPTSAIWESLLKEAKLIHLEEIERSQKIAELGAKLIPNNANLMTLCNTGSLATGGHGTALGIISYAHKINKVSKVFVCETRPLLQGLRLTAWELDRLEIPFTIITDNMVGYVMRNYKIDAVIVGADRIAANGDTANKIGTYGLAIIANFHKVPFYVAAPSSSIDHKISNGNEIIIEMRDPEEVKAIGNLKIALPEWEAISPAFDVTPAKLISGIITEDGIFYFPYKFFQK